MITRPQLQQLAEVSARIGGNRLLVQGPGGNTSIKDTEELWVKASGVWLSEAALKPIFVPLDRRALVEADGSPRLEIGPEAVMAGRNEAGLRPSIETALHALMPHAVVIHAHAVNAMAISALADGEALARARLSGLRWRWIPYRQPGAALAGAVRDAIADGPVDVLLLQNHGIVVGAATPLAAERLLERVEGLLRLEPRGLPAHDPAAIAAFEDERFEVHPMASDLAMDPNGTRVVTTRTLVPDQVVFFGGPIPAIGARASAGADAESLEAATGVAPALFLLPGVGALAARARTAGADALIDGLIEIARRIPVGATVNGLSDQDVAVLLGWEAEHHRRALDAQRQRLR